MLDGIARVDANTCAKATTNRRIITTTMTTLFNNIPLANAASGKGGVVFYERGRTLIAAQWLLMCVLISPNRARTIASQYVDVVGGTNACLFLVANDIVQQREYLLKTRGESHTQAVEAIGDGVFHVLEGVHGEVVLVEAFLGDEAVHVEGACEGGAVGVIAD